MKEMCRNFICTNPCTAAQNLSVKANTSAAPASIPNADCSACVTERIGLAQAFVPSQPYTAPMETEQSLVCGTAFSELVMPYCKGWNLYRFSEGV